MLRKFLVLWELPQVLLALMLFTLLKNRIILAIDYKDSKVFFARGFPGGISLSFMIFLNTMDLNSPTAIKHEYGHTLQSLYLGWLYLFIVGLPSLIRALVWNHFRLENKKYYEGFPEKWANMLGGVS